MNKITLALVTLLLVTACKKENAKEMETIADSLSVTSNSSLDFEAFGFPDGIASCACYFGKSKDDFDKENYIYVDDLKSSAQIKIKGKMESLNLLTSNDMDTEDEFSKEMENENYHVSIVGKKIKTEKEAYMFEGTMTITDVNGNTSESPIYGACGC